MTENTTQSEMPQSPATADETPQGFKELRELETLLGVAPEHTFMVNGRPVKFQVRKVKVRQVPLVIKAAGPLMAPLMNPKSGIELPQLMMFHPDECIAVLAALCDQPKAVIEELEVDQMLILLSDCIEVNVDFFVQRVLPLLFAGVARLQERVAGRPQLSEILAGTKVSSS